MTSCLYKIASHLRGDTQCVVHLSSLEQLSAEVGTVFHLEWLPKRRRVGPSASLDESIRKLFASYNMAMWQCQTKN